MRAKINDSLSAKVFLWIAGSLILCSFLIYGSILFFLPKSYVAVSSEHINTEIKELTETLSKTKFENAKDVLEKFCSDHQATIIVQGGGEEQQYGTPDEVSSEKEEMLSFAQEIQFSDRAETYMLNIIAQISSSHELISALLKLLPFLLIIIFLVSFSGAWICSRLIVKPVIEISEVSKRMEKLDMTWQCKINRTDEIGILANSLNSVSQNLSDTMLKLETANRQLKQDMEHIDELNKQRQYFFATASHELKTPITIIKGQVESMIMEIGRYKDTRTILPETLKEIENMEQLVKEILSISKLEMNTMSHTELLSLSNILKRVYKHLIPLANEKHIRIQKNISEDVMMMGNELLLEKAVHNIISNAIRHSPVGAELGLELSFDSLLVRNSGVNIPDEDLDKLFTPFYCVEKSHNKLTGGSGLGLYLVKIILEQHGLSYTIENRQDSVCFKITLNSHNLN